MRRVLLFVAVSFTAGVLIKRQYLSDKYLYSPSLGISSNINQKNVDEPSSVSLFQTILKDKCYSTKNQNNWNLKRIALDNLPITVGWTARNQIVYTDSSQSCFDDGVSIWLGESRWLRFYDEYSKNKHPYILHGDKPVTLKDDNHGKFITYLAYSGDGGFYSVYLELEGTKSIKMLNGETIYVTIHELAEKVGDDEHPLTKATTASSIFNENDYKAKMDLKIANMERVLDSLSPMQVL